MIIKYFSMGIILTLFLTSCQGISQVKKDTLKQDKMTYKINKTKKEWQEILSPAQFNILIEKGTERPGTGAYNVHFKTGIYSCAACDNPLFNSDNKYDSHCGWPSFDEAIKGAIKYQKDTSLGYTRTEILCANCGGHLGHIFDDGPIETTGKRYCVNSLSLDFVKKDNKEK